MPVGSRSMIEFLRVCRFSKPGRVVVAENKDADKHISGSWDLVKPRMWADKWIMTRDPCRWLDHFAEMVRISAASERLGVQSFTSFSGTAEGTALYVQMCFARPMVKSLGLTQFPCFARWSMDSGCMALSESLRLISRPKRSQPRGRKVIRVVKGGN